ncbi:hypothetical protein KR49_11975 [Synechococcus sp. KORDI-49]|nr:hypothetical protein KR49_11975 [Synechococcus sp. KORDI-49]
MDAGSAMGPTAGQVRQTASRERPRFLRVRITRRPVWERMRTRKPDTRLRLRLVPPRVRLVISVVWLPADQNS